MKYPFLTLSSEGSSRIEIKNSVFIGKARRVNTREEAEEFVSRVRDEYPDARHNCYAWITDGTVHMQKYSDDGEPSGTAGLPMLSVIEKPGITNAAVTVTRYFGGVLLGKGGLVKAYTEAAAAAIADAGLMRISLGRGYKLVMGYDLSDKIIYALKNAGFDPGDISYGSDVTVTCVIPEEREEEFGSLIMDKGCGRIEAERLETAELADLL